MMIDQDSIGGYGLLRENLYPGEIRFQAGTLELIALLGRVSFRDQDQAMPLSQMSQSLSDIRQKFNLLVPNRVHEADDALMLVRSHGSGRELFKAQGERAPETLQAVPVLANGALFDQIQPLADLLRCIKAVVQKGDKRRDRPIQVDVAFP